MTIRSLALGSSLCAAALLGTVALSTVSAQALTMRECSAKYRAAQSAGTLSGMKWSEFRKSQCGAGASAAAPAAPAATTGSAPSAAPAPSTMPAPMGSAAVYPNAVAPKYSSQSQGRARMHTCLDQYNANKAANANGGLKWVQRGGGYYSECNKRLKGA